MREPDRAQRRPEPVDEGHVVEPDERQVVRAAQAHLVQRRVAAHRQHVVADRHGGAPRAAGQQFTAAPGALFHGEPGRGDDQVAVHGEAAGLHTLQEAAAPPFAGRHLLGAGDVRNAGMPERGQVGDGHPHALLVVHRDRGEAVVGGQPVHQHDRHLGAGRLGQDRIILVRGRQHETVDVARPHLLEDDLLFAAVPVGVAEQGHVARGRQAVFQPAHDRREKRVVQVRDEHAHGVRAAGTQAACHRVGPVAERGRGLDHPAGGLLADEDAGLGIQCARGGRRVHPGGGGDIPQGGRPVRHEDRGRGPGSASGRPAPRPARPGAWGPPRRAAGARLRSGSHRCPAGPCRTCSARPARSSPAG